MCHDDRSRVFLQRRDDDSRLVSHRAILGGVPGYKDEKHKAEGGPKDGRMNLNQH